MSIKRIICCDVCAREYTEREVNEGFSGWGQLLGISLNSVDNPYLCPDHLSQTANFVNKLKAENK